MLSRTPPADKLWPAHSRSKELYFLFPAQRGNYPDATMQQQLATMIAKLGDHMVRLAWVEKVEVIMAMARC